MEQVKSSNWAKRQAFRPAACLLCALLASAWLSTAAAGPVVDSRVGGLSLIGPSSLHLASAYYNPATLTMSPGYHVFFDGTARLGVGSYSRRVVDNATGLPGTALEPAQEYIEGFPQLFLGFASDLSTKNVVLSIFACTPVAHRLALQQGSSLSVGDLSSPRPRGREEQADLLEQLFKPGEQGAARHHVVDLTLYHLNITTAASYRIIKELSIGLSVSYVFGSLDLAFVRDAALDGGTKRDDGEAVALDSCGSAGKCGYESAAAAEAIRTRGISHGIAFAGGVLIRPLPTLDIGVGYISEVVGVGGEDIPAKGEAWVLRSPAAVEFMKAGGSGVNSDLQGRSTVTYRLPHQVQLGLTWRPSVRLLFNFQARWQHLSTFDRFTVQLTGTEFREAPRMPDRISLYRGHQDVFAFQLGGGYLLLESLGLQGGVMLETASVPASATTIATIDGIKVDLFAGLYWRVHEGFGLRLGYGVALTPTRNVESSDFSPIHMVECVDTRFSVDSASCKAAAQGRGLPDAAGEYGLVTHRVGLGVAYDAF